MARCANEFLRPCLSRWKNKLPEIPAQVITKDGQIVDTSVDTWHFRAASHDGKVLELDWPALPGDYAPYLVSPRTIRILQLYLAHRLNFSKGHTVRNDFETVRRFLRWMRARVESGHHPDLRHAFFEWGMLDQTTFRLFLGHGLSTANKGNDFARLRDFYSWGAFVGRFPEFDIAEMYFSLQEDVRDAFLEGQLQAVHVTPLGLLCSRFQRDALPKVPELREGLRGLRSRHPQTALTSRTWSSFKCARS
jgi:hypothetical protein